MPLSTRELYLALRARDEATRNIQRFGRELTRTGNIARTASLKAQADSMREQATLLRTRIAVERTTLARMKEEGATVDEVRAKQRHIAALSAEAKKLDVSAAGLERNAMLAQRNAQRLEHMTNVVSQAGIGLQTLGVALVAVGAIGAVALKGAVDTAIEYERQVRLTSTQISKFNGNLQGLADEGLKVAKTTAVAFGDIQPALYDIYSSISVTSKQANLLLEAFAKAAVAGQTGIDSVSRGTLGILNAFKIPVEQVNHVLDKQFDLVRLGVGTYDEWIGRIGLVSPSAVRAGQSLDTMIAALAASTRFGIPAANSAAAVSRAFDALSNPTAIAALKDLGVNVLDAKGNFRDFSVVLGEFKDKLKGLPQGEQVKTIVDVFKGAGGTIQARRFLQSILMGKGGLEMFQDLLKQVKGDTGAFSSAYDAMSKTTAAKSQIISNKWSVMKEQIGQALLPALGKLLDFIGRLLDAWDRLSPKQKETIAKFAAVAAIVAIVSGVFFALLGTLAIFVSAMISVGSVMGTAVLIGGGLITAIALIGAAFAIAYVKSKPFRQIIADIIGVLHDLWTIAVDTATGIKDAWDRNLAPPLQRLADIINTQVLPAVREFMDRVWAQVGPKLAEAGRIIKSIASVAFEYLGWVINNIIIPAVKFMVDWWNRNKEQMQPLLAILGQVAKWLAIVAAVIVGVLFVAFVGPLVAAVMAGVAVFLVIVDTIANVIRFIKLLWHWILVAGKAIGDFFGGLGHDIASAWSSVTSFFGKIPATLGHVAGLLVQAGKDLISGFIQGVKDKIGELKDTVTGLAGNVTGWIKGKLGISSPSKVTMALGKNTALGFIIGYKNTMANASYGNMSLSNATPSIGTSGNSYQPRVGFGSPQPALMPTSKTINNTFNITTHEIDPRDNAAALGWELQGRM